MVASRVRGLQAESVLSSANARDTLKRRAIKPYQVEKHKVVGKKKKLAIQTSYHGQAAPGFAFLPVGTPDLAELCKELSRQRDYPVSVVNAQPTSSMAMNPNRVSHHVHRIGYHFRAEVIEDACEQLGYVPYGNTFVKTAELQRTSRMAQIFARNGLKQSAIPSQEDPSLIRAAIRELFPRIPDADLHEVVRHAWEEGEGRVGTAKDLPLARRVQLAVIARIRHEYTDYDRLLRAFDWNYARQEIEPVCLAKLIEWRGEHDGEDEELEEIVRETIVLDDDDDEEVGRRPSRIAAEIDLTSDDGNASDTSIEFSTQLAAPENWRAEDARDHNHRYLPRAHALRRTEQDRNNIARAKISAVRQQRPTPALHQQPQAYGSSAARPVLLDNIDHSLPSWATVAVNPHSSLPAVCAPAPRQNYVPFNVNTYALHHQPQQRTQVATNPSYTQTQTALAAQRNAFSPALRGVASIEPQHLDQQQVSLDTLARPRLQSPVQYLRPATPNEARRNKRQRVSVDLTEPKPHWRYLQDAGQPRGARPVYAVGDLRGDHVVDLTTPTRPYPMHGQDIKYARQPSPPRVRNYTGEVVDLLTPPRRIEYAPDVCVVSNEDRRFFRAPLEQPPKAAQHLDNSYDPAVPLPRRHDSDFSRPDGHARHAAPFHGDLQAEQPQWIPISAVGDKCGPAQPAIQYGQPVVPPQLGYNGIARVTYSTGTPQYREAPALVHGAPAPVQQMPREVVYRVQTQAPLYPQYTQISADTAQYPQVNSDGALYGNRQHYAS